MSLFDRLRRVRRPRGDARPLTCGELVEIITEYLEGALTPADRGRFEAHLEMCEGCRNYLDQMRFSIRAAGRLRTDSIPPQAKDTLLAAFRTYRQG